MLYKGDNLQEISFPLGGIGTGSIGLAGDGSFVDWEIFNRPNKCSKFSYSCFAVKAQYPDGTSIIKVLQGDRTKDLMGHGHGADSICGLPHFRKVTFDGRFPIAKVTFEDRDFPAKVILTAFNPFIPLDADNSSIPAAFFDVQIVSRADDVKYTVVLSACNPFESSVNEKVLSDTYTAIKMKHAGVPCDDKDYGDMTIAVACAEGICQEYWYRGSWQDSITVFWHELSKGTFKDRHYEEAGKRDYSTVGCSKVIHNRQKENIRFVLSWNIPNNHNYWNPYKDEAGKDITWKNYYAVLFADSTASGFYALDHWTYLYKMTKRFCKSLHSATLDSSVIDAVSATLSVLKSPTVLRLEDGTFYGWEGVNKLTGSCEGTCTHVWSYVYSLCFLFPELERSLRETELKYDTDEDGKMQFRTMLPLGRKRNTFHACVDGQMATLIKIYRDWKITGNSTWVQENWEDIKKVLEYAWSENNTHEWDLDKDGVLEGRQHHTLDMELFGPSSWLQGMYLGALKAAAEMAEFLGDTEKQKEYGELFERGYQWTRDNLFNGEYYFHKVDLENRDYIEHFQCLNYWNEEYGQLKYQIGEGCSIDQMLGQWHANICGLGDVFDKDQRRIALRNMFKNNFRSSLRDYPNVWRIFALNDEGGTLICDYPEGSNVPVIPIPYRDECMTGFEYAFAGLLISEGFVEEGLTVVRAIRDRYDGKKRNPWNEIECGSNYARAMASYALLPIFSGFTFDLPAKEIGFSPVVSGDFQCMWSLGTGWGDYIKTESEQKIVIASGYLELQSVALDHADTVKKIFADGKELPFTCKDGRILFDIVKVVKEIKFEVQT